MAEEKGKRNGGSSAEASKTEPVTSARKRIPFRTLLILVGVLLFEAALVSAIFIFAGRPTPVKAEAAASDLEAQGKIPVEEMVVTDRFQNSRSGRVYLYDTEIWIVVRKKDQPVVKQQLEGMRAQLTADMAAVFRKAEPAYLLDPTLSTLTRQIKGVLDQRLGVDSEGKPVIEEVLIKKLLQYRADI